MRFKMLILSLLLFIAFLAVTALCVNWDDPSYNTDEMISGGEVEIVTPPAGQAATPKLSRELQKNKSKSSLDWAMPSTLSDGGDSAKESRTQAESSGEETVASTAAEETTPAANTSTDTELPPAPPEVIAVSGNWYFTLNDSVVRDLALALFQNGTDVFGTGKIKEGNNTQDMTVSGSITDGAVVLNLVSTNPIVQYKLNLNLNEEYATGEYQAFSASGESWTGSAEGEKTA
jgi:hypothetical protein